MLTVAKNIVNVFIFYTTNFFSQLFNSEDNYGVTYRNVADLKATRHDNYSMINNYKDSLVPHQ